MATTPKLIVIVGETASGKSSLALQLAQRFNGEIISADSSTVRRFADIGTAKPTAAEQQLVPHHLLDIIAPDEPFSAAQFKQLAQQAISEITARGKLPILVGGTGLYIDSVLYDFDFRDAADPDLRQHLNNLSVADLHSLATERGLDTNMIDAQNPRRLIRLIETNGQPASQRQLRNHTLLLGLNIVRTELDDRIAKRVDTMLAAGLQHEAIKLGTDYGWDASACKNIGYAEWQAYVLGSQNLAQTRQLIIKNTRDLAKRQRTWFNRNKSIHWYTTPVIQSEVEDSVTTFLAT